MKQRSVLNPTPTDFTVTYDLDENGVGESWTLHSMELTDLPEPVAIHAAKHLADKILFSRSVVSDWQKEHDAVVAELLPPVAITNWEDEFETFK